MEDRAIFSRLFAPNLLVDSAFWVQLYPTAILAIRKPIESLHSQNVMNFTPFFLVHPVLRFDLNAIAFIQYLHFIGSNAKPLDCRFLYVFCINRCLPLLYHFTYALEDLAS